MTSSTGHPPQPNPEVPVYLAHVPGRIHPKVRYYVDENCPGWIAVETPEDDPFNEQSAIRRVWREHTGFIWLEQSSLPPAGAIAEYQQCTAPYCQRVHTCKGGDMIGAWACFKVAAQTTIDHPDLADRVLAGRVGDEWWRLGLLANRPYRPGAARPPHLDVACLDAKAIEPFGPWPGPKWPTTARRPYGDVQLHWAIEKRTGPAHVHDGASVCFPHTTDRERLDRPFAWYDEPVSQITR